MNPIALKLASRPKEFITDQEWDDDTLEKVLLAQDWQQAMDAYSSSPSITRGDSARMALQKAIKLAQELQHHQEIQMRLSALLQSDPKIQELIEENNQEWVKEANKILGRSDKKASSLIEIGKHCSPYVRKFIGLYDELLMSKIDKEQRTIIIGWLLSEKDLAYRKKIRTALDGKFGISTKPCCV